MTPIKSMIAKPVLWMGFALIALASCKSSQETQDSEASMDDSTLLLIHLDEEADGKTALASFEEIDKSSIKRVAMAQNIVQCEVSTPKERLKELMSKINERPEVISVKIAPTSPDKPSSSTNTDQSKTEPLREK